MSNQKKVEDKIRNIIKKQDVFSDSYCDDLVNDIKDILYQQQAKHKSELSAVMLDEKELYMVLKNKCIQVWGIERTGKEWMFEEYAQAITALQKTKLDEVRNEK